MITVKFWATIDGYISEVEGERIWRKIQHGKEVNFLVLDSVSYVYGKTSVYVLIDILRQFEKYQIQLHIE